MTSTEDQSNEADIIKAFVMENLGVSASAEDVAQWLNAKVPQHSKFRISRATAFNRMSDVHETGWEYLIVYRRVYSKDDPRYQMAQAIMELREAKVYEELQAVPA